ncbi:MAG: CBS domain-containing protein [Candidatus Kariarchaeaceae archaeon]
MKVGDVDISDDYLVVNTIDSVLEVAKFLKKEGIPDAVVVDDNDKVVGIIDDYVLVTEVLAEGKDVNETNAEDVMLTPPMVTVDTDLTEVEEILDKEDVTLLAVVDENDELLGVVTIMDVLEGLAKAHEPSGGLFSFLRNLF